MKRELIFTFCCLLTTLVWSQEYQRTETGIKASIFGKKIDVEVQWFNANSLRVLKMPHGQSVDKKSLSVIARPEKTALKVSTSEDGNIVMKSRLLTVKLDTKTGVLIYETRNGMPLLKELENVKAFIPVNDAGRATYSVYQSFKTDKDEGLYGLGQLQNGQMMQRGIEKYLVQGNTEDVTPVFQSTKGYGVFWDNYAGTMYVDNEEETSFRSEVGDCADYYFIYGSNADGVIAGVRDLTGQAPLYPLWTLGFWQCRERYKSPDELCEVVDEYRDRKVPLDGIIQDWQYWGCDSNWNSMKFQNPRYINKMGDKEYMKYLPNGENPDARYGTPRIKSPQEMIDYIHKRNAHIMISVWASFGPWTEMYHKMDSLNALLHFETWPPKAGVKPYDPFNPVARSIYWNEMKKNIFDLGMDGWWLDSTEPDHLEIQDKDFDTKTYLGSFRRVHNAFPLMSNKGVYEHQRATTSDKRVFLLTRSSFLGQQRYASHSWSGDVVSTWEVMRKDRKSVV